MTSDIKAEIDELKRLINYHNNLYYNNDAPEIADEEYDALYARLKTLEALNPQLVTEDSPTQRIGGAANKQFSPVVHKNPMMSLDNTYSKDEILAWHERTAKALNKANFDMVVEAKIDGVSCSITYAGGALAQAATRGDGRTGEDITLNVKTIHGVPHKIPFNGNIEIRGEVYIEKHALDKLNHEQNERGLNQFANTRNAAAGSLRQKDFNVTAARPLKFFAHSFGAGDIEVKSFSDFISLCRGWGFDVTPVRTETSDINKVIEFYDEFAEKRHSLPYEADGLVVKVNSFEEQLILGRTAKSPRWAVAFKYAAARAKTVVEEIIFSVGRTGVITPVAKLKPVACAGVIIANATLHNFDEIQRLGVAAGDEVEIERAGEVIPKVVRVITKHNFEPVAAPAKCPSCGAQAFKDEDGVAVRCLNPACPAQVFGRLIHFASRAAMDIDGFGDIVAAQLLEKGYLTDFAGIYKLTKEQLLTLELFKDKKADNLLAAIAKSKSKPLSRLLYAFGVRHVGEKTAESIAKHFKTLDALLKAKREDIERINEVGPVVGGSVFDFFTSPEVRAEIENLRALGLNFTEPETEGTNLLEGKTFVFTGELTKMTRAEAEALVKKNGGKTAGSVSAKTGFVVAGADAGSKLEKAKKLGVKVLTEREFIAIIKL